MLFQCVKEIGNRKEERLGKISCIKNYGSHFEIQIQSRSSLMVLFGETSRGYFASIPDFDVGCHLVDPQDIFWNSERLTRILGKVDGHTAATALYTAAAYLKGLKPVP